MTCIVGLVHGGRVFLAGDSLAGSGGDAKVRSDVKVFRNESFVFGCTTSFRMHQLLQYAFKPPTSGEGDEFAYMCTAFVDEVRRTLKTGGWAKRDNENEVGGDFLVGRRGRLFQIHSDYQVAETAAGFDACGCGQSYALGSLFTTAEMRLPPHERLTLALEAAQAFSSGVRAPFNFIETPP